MKDTENDGFVEIVRDDMVIRIIRPEPDAQAQDTANMLGKRTEVNVEIFNHGPWRMNRYPWQYLRESDSYMVIKNCKPKTTRILAYGFARRHGFNISSSIKGNDTLWVWRVLPTPPIPAAPAAPEPV